MDQLDGDKRKRWEALLERERKRKAEAETWEQRQAEREEGLEDGLRLVRRGRRRRR